MITFRGVVLVVAAIFTFLLARLTQVGWLYLADATLWGIILLSLAVPSLMVMSLSVRRRLVRSDAGADGPGPSEGDTVRLELSLDNGRSWPRYFLSIGYDCPLAGPDERSQRYFVRRVNGAGTLVLGGSVRCHRRGLYQFGRVTVESKAPFGLFRRRRRLESPLSVLVYPRVYPMSGLHMLEAVQGTEMRPRRTPTGLEIAGSRHYVRGDPIRHIHWRNTARVGRPMVKEFEDSQEDTLVIAFDSSRDTGEGPDSTLEYSVKLSASVAGHVMARGRKVRVLTGGLPDHEVPWAALLKEMALLEMGRGPGLPALVGSLPSGSRVLALVSEDDIRGLEALAAGAGHMAGLAVVVLEGFGDAEPRRHSSGIEGLRGTGVPLLSCRPGELAGTLRSLEQVALSRVAKGHRTLTGRRA